MTGSTGPQGRHLGHLVRLRPTLAMLADNWPNIATTFTLWRALAWWLAGWPVLGTATLAAYGYVVATHWKLTAAVIAFGFVVDLIPNDVAKALDDRIKLAATWLPRILVVGLAGYALSSAGLGFALAVVAAAIGFGVLEWSLTTMFPVYDLWRLWCQFRRRLPTTWTQMAGKTKAIQGAGVGGEVTLARSFRSRPWLDHPAMNFVPRFDSANYRVIGRVFSPPGRDMEALAKIADALASDDPFVARLQIPYAGVHDSYAPLVIDFHRRARFGVGRARG